MLKKFFNKAALTYDLYSELQTRVGKKLLSIIQKKSSQYQNIIDIGCGTGFTTREFAKELRYQYFHALDFSENLLNIARTQLQRFSIPCIEADFEKFESPLSFDLIYSNMSLQWSTHILSVINNLKNHLQKNGIIAFSIPLEGTFIELEKHVQIRQFIQKNIILDHFNVSFYDREKITLKFPSLLHALQSIKKIGANGTEKKLSTGLYCNPFLKKLMLNPSSDSTTLTYQIGYFIIER